jgi:peptidyl-tRNA hydrolase, PTH1 family
MKVIIGLGNPEDKYTGTRHNVGFFVLDRFAAEHEVQFQQKAKFKAQVGEMQSDGEKVLLVKPTTFYNNVGESYRAVIDFYNAAPEDVLVIADDLALPFGTLRTRGGGSDAGNNGIKSINAHGGEGTNRLRIGISNELRTHIGDVDFVLSKFSKPEAEALSDMMPRVLAVITSFLEGSFETTTHRSS